MLTLNQRQERATRRAARIAAKHEAIRAAACTTDERTSTMKKPKNQTKKGKPVAAKGAAPAAHVGTGAKRAAEVAKEAKPAKPAATGKKRGMGVLDAAVRVLQEAGKTMNCADIVKVALEKGYWKTSGKTPAATIYAAIIREIGKKGAASRFRKVERGQFALAK